MKIILIIVFLSTLGFSKNLVIQPRSQDWSTLSTATGDFNISKPFINIALDKLLIRQNKILKNGKKVKSSTISSIRIGIAKLTKNGRWNVERWGMSKKINKQLKPSETIELTNFKTTIPIDGITDLSEYWFVIQTTINKSGTTYSHSKTGLFKKINNIKNPSITRLSRHYKHTPKMEFWKPICNEIMQYWQRTISLNEGMSATVKIRIDNKGKFTFKNLKLSNNKLFDKKLITMLKHFENKKWASYKYGKFIESEFEFRDKEKR